jgi:hypothetical protein
LVFLGPFRWLTGTLNRMRRHGWLLRVLRTIRRTSCGNFALKSTELCILVDKLVAVNLSGIEHLYHLAVDRRSTVGCFYAAGKVFADLPSILDLLVDT